MIEAREVPVSVSAVAAKPQPSHSNLFLRATPANANPMSAAVGPIYGEGLLSSESCFLIHRVPSSFLTKIKPIPSKFTHQLFPLISLHHRPPSWPTLHLLVGAPQLWSSILMEFTQWPSLHPTAHVCHAHLVGWPPGGKSKHRRTLSP